MRKQNTTVARLNKLMEREEWLMRHLGFFSRMNSTEPAVTSALYSTYQRNVKWEIELENIRLEIRDTEWDDEW